MISGVGSDGKEAVHAQAVEKAWELHRSLLAFGLVVLPQQEVEHNQG
jgi:hypothetical protein